MSNLPNYDAESGANLIADDTGAGFSFENSGGGAALEVVGATGANASISGLQLTNSSVASGAAITLSGTSFVSVTTIKATTGAVAGSGAIRVIRTDGSLGWIPVYPDGTITAAAVE